MSIMSVDSHQINPNPKPIIISNNSTSLKKKNKINKNNEVRYLQEKDIYKAALTLKDAFSNDSLSKLLVCHIKDHYKRDYCELLLYEAYIKQHLQKGIVLVQGENDINFETVSIWSHPKSEDEGLDSFFTLMQSGFDKVWENFEEKGRNKIFSEDGMLTLLHDSCERIINNDLRFKNKPIYTLVYVGSTKQAQGKGNLRKMFEFMFKNYIDPNNALAYLESSSPNNIPIYEKFDFHFVEDIMLGENDFEGAIEGEDYAIMNVMIRGIKGQDWSKINVSKSNNNISKF
ncbi:uncharacterized protein KGF55_002889 [Candida pseudojiufengensis]|uniref:uncharacterized protein n=1 Tax=Candida pseudojiufengensis TaxID=497109 RepID=UPI002224377B|nr:uncharacterized protein KGF55_002889 [Candida pseudojiufengensis]KAI5963097.1 hypothetical protein KGF55_002889 [Candida pseudojiufengensis]